MAGRIGLDDLAGDVFSLNVRGVVSIGTLWRWPQRYFEAAADTDWLDRYTPSVRLWLSLIALSSLLQFFWIGADAPVVQAYTEGFRDAGVILPEGTTYAEVGELAALWIFSIFPVVQLVMFLLVLPLFRLWGHSTSFSQRVRYGFAMMVPSASLMVFLLPAMAVTPAAQVAWFGFGIGVLAFAIDASTVFRGGVAGSLPARLAKAGLLAGIVLVLNIAAHMATQIAGIIAVSIRLGLVTG